MNSRWHLAVLALGLAASGCGGGAPDDAPGAEDLVPAWGIVTVDDGGAGGISLSFQPEPGTPGTGGFAATDSTGNFKIKHRSGLDGLEPGKYRVVLSRMLTPEGNPVPDGESAMDHNAQETLPAQYTDAAQTPLQVEITDGTLPLAIEVTTK